MESDLVNNTVIYSGIINKHSNFILTSYYWGNKNVNKGSIHKLTYGEQVQRLIKDCKKIKVNYFFVECLELSKPGKNYQESIGLKPNFIQLVMKKFKNLSVIYVDTDLRLLKYPSILDIDADCFFTNAFENGIDCYNPLQLELSGGIMGFGNTPNGRVLLDILKNNLDIKYVEDKTFSGIITRNFLNIHTRCVWLPSTYLYMFMNHTYDDDIHDYSNIVNYKDELYGSYYKKSDLVFVHEDFETEMLKKVFSDKVQHDRYPINTHTFLGEKLRCYTHKFVYYKHWGLNKKQETQKHIDIDFQRQQKILSIKDIKHIPKKIPVFSIISKNIFSNSNFIVVYFGDDHTEMLESYCHKKNISYCIIDCNKNAKHALILYKLMKYFKKSIIYVPVLLDSYKFDKLLMKNMDIVTYNMNNDFETSKCFDPRILKLKNTPIYLDYNTFVLDFLLIWADNTKKDHYKHQYLAFEYAFNISTALNKLRCFWIKNYFINSKRNTLDINNKLINSMQQCGLKPSRISQIDYYAKTHFKGSVGKKEKLLYSHLFKF